jgi:uncharacterized repeat protein (TIGR01451 family)
MFARPAAAATEAARLDQCANGGVGPPLVLAPCLVGTLAGTSYSGWVTGDVNSSKAHWKEGQFISYRATITGLSSGSHDLVIDYETVHGSTHALDYIGSYDATETTSPTASAGNRNDNNPCFDTLGPGGGSGCTSPGIRSTPAATTPVPSARLAGEKTCAGASGLPNFTPAQIPGTIDLFAPTAAGAGMTSSAAQYVSENVVSGTGQCDTQMSITFTLSGTAPSGGWTVELTWGGHIASALDWGVGNSASSISGSPYHMALVSLDRASTGAQDRALAESAVAGPPTIATQVSKTSISLGGSLTDTATLTGSAGTVTGTVQFQLCSNTTTACPQITGTNIGSPVTLVGGAGTSPSFGSNLAAGNYCVGLVYVDDDNSFYSSTYSGSATNECFTVNAAAIQVAKTADASSVNAGDPIGFTVEVTNGGTGTANGVTVNDPLPAGSGSGVTWSIDSQSNPGLCLISGTAPRQVLSCGPTTLTAGASFTVHIAAVTSASECTGYDNTASVTTINDGSGSSEAKITCSPGSAHLSLAKSASPTTAVPGNDVTFTLLVKNSGPDAATNVTVRDPLPLGLTFVSASPGCSFASGTVTCTVVSLAAGASRSFMIVAHIAASAKTGFVNVATTSSQTPDPDPNDSSAVINVPLGPRAELQMTKVASASTIPAGGQEAYTLIAYNNGPSDASGVTIHDPVPAGMTIASAIPSQGSCTTNAGVVCMLGPLPAGGSAQVLVTVRAASTLSGSVTNTASVVADQPNAHPSDASASATTTVQPPPPPPALPPAQPVSDLQIVKRVDHARAYPGQTLTYTLVVTNLGPDAASAAHVTDTETLPRKVLSLHTSQGSCQTGAQIVCALGTIPAGGHVNITIRGQVTRAGTATNAASVVSASENPHPAGALSAAVTKLTPILRVSKTASPRVISAGENVSFAIKLTNPTSAAIAHVTVCDALPGRLLFVHAAPRSHLSGENRYCWKISSLGAHRSRTFMLVANAEPGTGALVTNRTSAAAPGVSAARSSTKVRIKPAPRVPCAIASQAVTDTDVAKRSGRASEQPGGRIEPIAKAAC